MNLLTRDTGKPEPMMKGWGAPTSAYIHIPFCRRRCYYCDFPVSVVGDQRRGENSSTIVQYVQLLCQEILTTPAFDQPLETVFFGGGTPSLLSVQQLQTILETLQTRFGMTSSVEISMEMDPGTFELTHLKGYRQAGVNRVSLGVQAFQSDLLAASGRTHTVEDIAAAVDLMHQAEISNFGLDLISGLPHLTMNQWQESLRAAIALHPVHLSVYDLIVEPVTAFGRWYRPGEAPLPSDEATADMYRLAQQTLTAAGYEHYEISNYARPGYQCRHNRVYWENRPFYGFGMGAASYLNQIRFTRPRKRQEYSQWVHDEMREGLWMRGDRPSSTDLLLDTLMVGLRLSEGLSLGELADSFGQPHVETILTCLYPYYQQGWVEVVGASLKAIEYPNPVLSNLTRGSFDPDMRIRLTDPEGFLFSNVVLTSLFEKIGS